MQSTDNPVPEEIKEDLNKLINSARSGPYEKAKSRPLTVTSVVRESQEMEGKLTKLHPPKEGYLKKLSPSFFVGY